MKFETIIFLVILFNVVTAFLQRRAKKQKEKRKAEAAAAASLKPSQTAPRSVPQPGWEAEEEEVEDENEEHAHSGSWHAEEEGEEHPANTKGKTVSLGKGMLEHLARELGLRIPESEAKPEIPVSKLPQPIRIPEASIVHDDERTDARDLVNSVPPQAPAPRAHAPFGLDMLKMREAVVLREILDKPVSLRTGRFK